MDPLLIGPISRSRRLGTFPGEGAAYGQRAGKHPCPGCSEGLITEDEGREAGKEDGVPLESGFYQMYVEALSSLGSVV